jgi:hypothetical protein
MTITLAFQDAFEFGMNGDSMIDMTDVVCHPAFALMLEPELYEQMVNALMDAVDYNAHGQDRTGAEGLSFCYATNLSATELNQYALNCFSPHYLAFLDAIIPGWEAPDSLYEQVPRLPSIEEHPAYQIQLTKRISEDGSPGVVIRDGLFYIDLIYANLIRLNPETGNPVRMGIFLTEAGNFQEDGGLPYTLREVWRRPALEGVLCDAELVTVYQGEYLYNIPLQIDGETFQMRCGIRLEEGRLSLRPCPNKALGFAKAEWRSPVGTIRSAWEYHDDKLIFDFTVPVPASIELPDGTTCEVKEGEHRYEVLL